MQPEKISPTIRTLILAARPAGAEAIVAALRQAGGALEWRNAQTEAEFAAGFEPVPDIVLAEYAAPQFSGLQALRWVRERAPEVPFIMVAEKLNAGQVADCLQQGATDCLPKDQLSRLGSVVAAALQNRRLSVAPASANPPRDLQITALETAANAIVIADRQGRIIWVNPAFTGLTGYSREEVVGGNPRLLKSGRHAAAFYRELWATILAGRTWRGEFINRRKDGSLYYGEQTITPVRSAAGAITHFVGIMNDVTDRKRAEEALRQSEERLARIFQANPAAIGYCTRSEGRWIDVNHSFTEFFGYPREAMLGRTADELGLWCDPAERDACLAQLHTQQTVRNVEARFRRQSGETRVALISLDLLEFAAEPVRMMTLIDITEKKSLETHLLRAQRMESVGRLASGIAHDLNNVLAPIVMSVPLLEMELPQATAAKMLHTIETSARRGADLVRLLLLYGRGVEGRRGLVRPQHLVKEVANMAQETFPKSIAIGCDAPSGLWAVPGEPTQLHQIVLNLCVNARDAMPQGGTLALSAANVHLDEDLARTHPEAKPGPHVRLSVRDTGTGIAPEIIDKIFDPFFSTKAVGQGTGLGLATVLAIVKRHDGFVALHTQVGVGTTFEVYLPAAPQDEVSAVAPTAATAPAGHGELILVVDDERGIRDVTHNLLTRYGYRVLTAGDGLEAIALFALHAQEIKVVVTDTEMPNMDGIRLIRVLRKMSASLPIVVSSGTASGEEHEMQTGELASLGVSKSLAKPYATDEILRVLGDLVSAP
jgi:two-component system, cell cycle sensor histidine kinase and response regulator CckA